MTTDIILAYSNYGIFANIYKYLVKHELVTMVTIYVVSMLCSNSLEDYNIMYAVMITRLVSSTLPPYQCASYYSIITNIQ